MPGVAGEMLDTGVKNLEKIIRDRVESGDWGGQLHLNHFPVELKRELRIKALETDVTFRELVIGVLRGYCNGLGESGGDGGTEGVSGMSEGVSHGGRTGGSQRHAKAIRSSDRAPADTGQVDGGIRADQGENTKKAEGDEW